MAEYPYTKASVNSTKLTLEIEANETIVTTLEYINWASPNSLSIFFDGTLSGPEETALDTLVSNHDGNPPTLYDYFCYCCGLNYEEAALSEPTQCQCCSSIDIQGQFHKCNLIATSNPTVSDDITKGYCKGSNWLNVTTGRMFWCVDNTEDAAIWKESALFETDAKLRIHDPGSSEYGIIHRDGNSLIIESGTGAQQLILSHLSVSRCVVNAIDTKFLTNVRPNNDGVYTSGSLSYHWLGTYTDNLYIGDGNLIQTKESPGTELKMQYNIPVGEGGAAAAALDHQMKIDGVLESGLLAETDGVGSYREPVFKIPYMEGDYEADWSTLTLPSPASLVNGCEVLVWNTNGAGEGRRYSYMGNGWRYETLT